jgi:hypothetical protein
VGLGLIAAVGIAVAMFAAAPSTADRADKSSASASAAPTAAASPATGGATQGVSPSGAARGDGPTSATDAPTPTVVDAGPPLSPNVKIVFEVVPKVRATVRRGKETLGVIPRRGTLTIERPRDSGPLDVVIRAPGFVTVFSRAYTFDDATVDVKLTPNDKKDTLYGYKEPLPPEDAGAPEP